MGVEASQRQFGYQPSVVTGGATSRTQDEEGADTPDGRRKFVAQVHEWYRNSARTTQTWRTRAIESYQFAGNEQWDQDDLSTLDNATVQRPHLVINKILSPILLLAGMQRQARTQATLLPFSGQNPRGAELMSLLLKYVSKQSHERKKDSRIFLDKIITGLGYWKIVMDYEVEPDGRPDWTRAHPLSIYADPNWFDQEWSDAEYVIHATWFTRPKAQDRWSMYHEEIAKQFGEWLTEGGVVIGNNGGTAESAGDSWSGERLFWDPDTQRIRVLETWYKRRVTVTVARNSIDGQIEGDQDRVKSLRDRARRYPAETEHFQFIERPVTQIRVATVLNDLLLSDESSPFDEAQFPIFPATAYYFWQNPFGIVEPLKDPQRQKNKTRSTTVEIIHRMPISGFFNRKIGGAKTEDIENFANGSGAQIPYEDIMPTAIKPPELPQTLVFLDQKCDQEMAEIISTRALAPAAPGYTTSAKHVEAIQRPGVVSQEPLIDSFRDDKEPAIKFMVKAIQQYMPVSKAIRILGTMAARDKTGQVQGMLTSVGDDVQTILQDAMLAEYDTVIDDTKPWEPSLRMTMFNTLREIAREYPGFIPPEVLISRGQEAGIIDEDDAAKILAFANARIQAEMGGGMPPPPSAPSTPTS
jgi:hypothetical protein